MNTDRLLALADYMDKIGTKRPFDYNTVVHECGTNGCALWDLHKLAPNEIPITLFDGPLDRSRFPNVAELSGRLTPDLLFAVRRHLEISFEEFRYLFEPFESGLGELATREQVAAHIRNFAMANKSLTPRSTL